VKRIRTEIPQLVKTEIDAMKNKVKAMGTVDFQRAVSYLEEALTSLKSGDLVLTHGENSVTFHPKDVVEVEIEAKEKEGKQEFSFEMTWKEGLQSGDMSDFSISGGESVSRERPLHSESEQAEFRPSAESKVSGACVGVAGGPEASAACSEM
jgi:amphi-Trp domain-containing protein